MQLDAQAMRTRCGKHTLRLGRREADRLAVRIHGIGGAHERGSRNHFVADVIDVIVRASGKFRWKGVRGEERRAHVDAELFAQRTRDRQLLQFGFRVEPVSGLDFDGRDAFGQKRGQARAALRGKFGGGSRAGRPYRCHDAATLAGDIRISGAVQAPLEFAGAIARVDEMRMAVDEAGRQPSPPAVPRLPRDPIPRNIASAADPRDQAAAHTHGTVSHHAIGNAVIAHRCEVRVDQQQVEWR
jgi:hypothetical protein